MREVKWHTTYCAADTFNDGRIDCLNQCDNCKQAVIVIKRDHGDGRTESYTIPADIIPDFGYPVPAIPRNQDAMTRATVALWLWECLFSYWEGDISTHGMNTLLGYALSDYRDCKR